MKTISHDVAGDTVTVYVPESDEDIVAFRRWLDERPDANLGLDTETTGLDIWSAGFDVRTVQFGDRDEAWVLRTGRGWDDVVRDVLATRPRFVLHNAPYDALVLDRVGLAPLADLLPRMFDTYILAHLLDPRSPGEDGAPGLSLKALAGVYVDPDAKDAQTALKETFRALGARKLADGWRHPDIVESDVYLLYAGLDVVYVSRLIDAIGPMIRSLGMTDLAMWEHRIQEVTTRMTHRGVLVDVPYVEALIEELDAEAAHFVEVARRYGVENVNSVAQVRDALLAMDVELTSRTATGNLSVGKDALLPLAGLTPWWTPIEGVEVNPLADAVVRAKRAAKWRKAYAEEFLRLRDENDRIHPGIKSLAARTARMSVSAPPLQQLPAGDWRIRRALIADPGHVFVSSDFSQVELRVLAGNGNVAGLKAAVRDKVDLHTQTARMVYGEGFTKAQRGVAKAVNFGYVFGGGAGVIAKTAGIPIEEARDAVTSFVKAYPELPRYAKALQREAARDSWAIRTFTGRRLPLSRERSYAATNYCLAPDTPVLTADLRHVRADEVRVGDRLVGFDEFPSGVVKGNGGRRFKTAVVEIADVVEKPSVEIVDSTGRRTVCSADHRWLVRRRGAHPRHVWVEAQDLLLTDEFIDLGVWDTGNTRDHGYLSGLYDGEGHLSKHTESRPLVRLSFSQKPGLVMDEFLAAMDRVGLRHSYSARPPRSTSPCDTALVSSLKDVLRTLGTLRPARFIPRTEDVFTGVKVHGGAQFHYPTPVSVTAVGKRTLVSLQTSTRTLVANGYLSHNCTQSGARDVFAAALLRVSALPGMDERLSLVIHDEILVQAPIEEATEIAATLARTMSTTFKGVAIDAEAEVFYGGSWGSGPDYKMPAERDAHPDQRERHAPYSFNTEAERE